MERYRRVPGIRLEPVELVPLAEAARSGSLEARDRLVLGHVPAAVAVVERFLHGLQLEADWSLREEMLASGLALLVEVAGRWDPAVSTFPNFAHPYLHRACVEVVAGRAGVSPYWRRVLEERGAPVETWTELDAPAREGEPVLDVPDPYQSDPETAVLEAEAERLGRLADALEVRDVPPAVERLGLTRRGLAQRTGFAPDDFSRWERAGVELGRRQRFVLLSELWPAVGAELQQRAGVNWSGSGNPYRELLTVRPEVFRRRPRRVRVPARLRRGETPALREVRDGLPAVLRTLRAARNVSQRQLAAAWGVRPCVVGNWEHGRQAVPLRRLPPVLVWCATGEARA